MTPCFVEITDEDTVTWRQIRNLQVKPCARAAHSSAAVSNKNQLFVFGGFTGATTLNDLWMLDLGEYGDINEVYSEIKIIGHCNINTRIPPQLKPL